MRFTQSWTQGVKAAAAGQGLDWYQDELSWGSLGKTHGYLYGDFPVEERKAMFEQMVSQFLNTLANK